MYRKKEKEFMRNLVIKIVKFRYENELTQEEFAEKIEYYREHIAKVETGKRNLSLRYIIRICLAFDVEIGELFSK